VRDQAVEPGHHKLVKVFSKNNNIIGIDKILGTQTINAPPVLKNKNQVGFVDIIPDQDGNYRRIFLGVPIDNNYRFSLPLMLAENYLKAKDFNLKNGKFDFNAMAFENKNTAKFKEIPRFLSNTGGYVNAEAGGVQMLVNFRQNSDPFIRLSLADINNNSEPNLIKDKIVLIGITAPSVKDFLNNKAVIDGEIAGQIYGVEFLAHGTSQIISAVEDRRSLLTSWFEIWEYLWILSGGLILILIAKLIQKPFNLILSLGFVTILQIGISYLCLIIGLWIPIVPILFLNLLGLFSYLFYNYDLSLKTQINTRQKAIDDFYEEIHRLPLQNLALLLRDMEQQKIRVINDQKGLIMRLKQIDQQIRSAYEEIEKFTLYSDLSDNKETNSQSSLSIVDLLNKTYQETIQKYSLDDLALVVGFQTFKEESLNFEQRQNLCLFLEEMLCNINKHAQGVKRIIVEGKTLKDKKGQEFYVLKIEDNGMGITDNASNRLQNKKFIKRLEKQLNGKFTVNRLPKIGTLCEFTWQLKLKN
jgi:CHASE2 domain-containing sensor protein/two-component sensor histidine kinase